MTFSEAAEISIASSDVEAGGGASGWSVNVENFKAP